MCAFKRYHPVVNFVYFLAVIGFSMVFLHPVCLFFSLAGSLSYCLLINGRQARRFILYYLFPLMLLSAFMNPAFNHAGVTILTYLPGGNPLTAESILYGAAAACMLASVIGWFSCVHVIMTSDKLMYLFGRITPALSLLFSMVLRFVPKFKAQAKAISYAQKCMTADAEEKGVIQRAKQGVSRLSALITWSLENAVETADSMRSRGYGLPGRTAFSNYKMDKRDMKMLLYIIALSLYFAAGGMSGQITFHYFPSLSDLHVSFYSITLFTAYFLLCGLPVAIEIWEEYRWKQFSSKM